MGESIKTVPRRRVAILVDISWPTMRDFVVGVSDFVRESQNWQLLVTEPPFESISDHRRWRADGVIANFHDSRIVAVVRRLKVPVVGTGGGGGWFDARSRIPYLATDNAAIARMAADHLLDRGYRHFAFCGYRKTRLTDWSVERAQVFRARLAERDFPCDVFLAGTSRTGRWSDLRNGLPAFLRKLPKPVGLMACNDGCAQRVLEACRIAGVAVPDDLGVIGVDNDKMMCELSDPPLTSIEQGSRRLGYEAAQVLSELFAGREPSRLRRAIAPAGLFARQSTEKLMFDDPEVRTALSFIQSHASEGIAVEDVLLATAVSRSTLDRKFLAALGRSVHAEIHRTQVQQVKELLQFSDLSIKQIARRAGFRTVQYLSTVFRKAIGQSPTQYRRETARPRSM